MIDGVEIGKRSLSWRKSSFSVDTAACVEVADLPTGGRAVRDSKDPTGPALSFTAPEWVAFIQGAQAGEFS